MTLAVPVAACMVIAQVWSGVTCGGNHISALLQPPSQIGREALILREDAAKQ